MNAANGSPQKLGTLPYVLAGVSYIPLIGVLFGVITIIWGLVTRKQNGKRLAAIGAGGIGFTVLLYGGLFYFAFIRRGGVYDDLRVKLAQSTLTALVQSIEFYKVQRGSYPETLKILKESLPKDSLIFINDPTDVKIGGQPRDFFYERAGAEHYYLRGLGHDGIPFTADDIVPEISASPGGRVGLLLERASTAK